MASTDAIIFEAFEASPRSKAVLASENALLWSFPGRASQLPSATFANPNFQQSLADFLEKASMDSLSRFCAKTRKRSVDIMEIRDTSSPALITQMLMPLLDTIGNSIQTPLLHKRIRDDSNIDDSLLPWRRQPFWLILRVALQRHLCLSAGESEIEGRALYKVLAVINLTHLLTECSGKVRPELALLLRNKICRRLAKLEMDKAQQVNDNIYKDFLVAAAPWLEGSIESVTQQISMAWESFKSKTTRKTEYVPAYAAPVDLRLALPSSALEEVEQEREVKFQAEEIRQVAKPVKYQALKFLGLHSAISRFATTGQLEGYEGFIKAFYSLKNTAIGKRFEVRGTRSRFYCSTAFTRTVALSKQVKTANIFLRPVQWILWSPSTATALIIIPEEAELLIPVIRRAGSSSPVHLLSYAAPVTKQMMHFNDLKYYALPDFPVAYELPTWLRIELGLFAGRLYVSYDECDAIREYLRMSREADGLRDENLRAENKTRGSEEDVGRVLFTRKPIAFLLE